MKINKREIFKNICYTELVYERINKKLSTNYSKKQIKELVMKVLKETGVKFFIKKGKNLYIKNIENNIVLTINSSTFRIITVNRIVS
jgi:hypothetical protein